MMALLGPLSRSRYLALYDVYNEARFPFSCSVQQMKESEHLGVIIVISVEISEKAQITLRGKLRVAETT